MRQFRSTSPYYPDAEHLRALLNDNAAVRQHYQSREVAVTVPLLQAVVTGATSAVVIGMAIGGFALWIDHSPILPGLVGAVASFPVITLAAWLNRMADWRSLIWQLETALKVDIDQDETIGEPETVRVEVLEKDTGRQVFGELPHPRKLPAFFSGVLAGRGLAETTWGGKGKLFTLPEFRNLRDILLQRGWIEFKDPEAPLMGYRLTRQGEAVARYFASRYDQSPPPA